jgi:hypothetical protein
MPLLINQNNVIERITFDKPVAEPPLRESWLREFVHKFWVLVSGE